MLYSYLSEVKFLGLFFMVSELVSDKFGLNKSQNQSWNRYRKSLGIGYEDFLVSRLFYFTS